MMTQDIVFEMTDEVSFPSLLENHHGGTLESQEGLQVLGEGLAVGRAV